MPLDLTPLLERAFLVAEAADANTALGEARERFDDGSGRAFSYEVVAPPEPDANWLEERLLHRLVYHCESTRAPLPECRGVFVSLFAGSRLHCIAAEAVVAFGAEALGVDAAELVRRYGTGESREPQRGGPAGLLPPPHDGGAA